VSVVIEIVITPAVFGFTKVTAEPTGNGMLAFAGMTQLFAFATEW
jgi:hypothetical protein